MGRQLTQQEIDSLKIWNETPGRKYVSIEAIQDVMDWMPDPDSPEYKILKGEMIMEQTQILRQKNPTLADLVDKWNSRFAKSYDFNSTKDQADFYEGVLEMARHMASASSTGRLELEVSPDGPTSLKLNVIPLL